MKRSTFLAVLSVQIVVAFAWSTAAETNGLISKEQELREIDELIAQGKMEEVIPGKHLAKGLALPRAFDRSLDKAHPPIRSQSGGSCTGWASTYYSGTYVIAKREGWNAAEGGDQYRLSPHWTYNFVNGGSDAGSSGSRCNEVLRLHGGVSWADFYPPGTVDRTVQATVWCGDPDAWRQAIWYRFESTKSIRNIDTDEGLILLKENLYDPLYTNSYGTNSPSSGEHWQFITILDNPATPADDGFVGQKACYKVDSNHGGRHAMTVVGWNDDIWVDVNQNGAVDDGEIGVLKVAESHGVRKTNSNQGYYWLAYDALHTESQVVNGPNEEREEAISGRSVLCAKAPAAYAPTLAASFTLQSAARDDIHIEFRRVETSAAEPYGTPEDEWEGWVFGSWRRSDNNRHGFDGNDYTSTDEAPEMTFVFDLTDIYPSAQELGETWKYVMVAQDLEPGLSLVVKSFSLIDPVTGNELATSSDVPITLDDATGYATISYRAETGVAQRVTQPVTGRLFSIDRTRSGTVVFNVNGNTGDRMLLRVVDVAGKTVWRKNVQGNEQVQWNSGQAPHPAHRLFIASLEHQGKRTVRKVVLGQ
ncbi:MAG: hypothetical protein JW768_05785 [Chitinispirillaceae bacterium]|nr:hypothetical protein [Chitinispirillaceae bacterium]